MLTHQSLFTLTTNAGLVKPNLGTSCHTRSIRSNVVPSHFAAKPMKYAPQLSAFSTQSVGKSTVVMMSSNSNQGGFSTSDFQNLGKVPETNQFKALGDNLKITSATLKTELTCPQPTMERP